MYWREPFDSLCQPRQLTEYTVIDCETIDLPQRGVGHGHVSAKVNGKNMFIVMISSTWLQKKKKSEVFRIFYPAYDCLINQEKFFLPMCCWNRDLNIVLFLKKFFVLCSFFFQFFCIIHNIFRQRFHFWHYFQHVIADVWVQRSSELGQSDAQTYNTKTHLGHILAPGDTVAGLAAHSFIYISTAYFL